LTAVGGSAGAMLFPMAGQPLDLAAAQVCPETLVMQAGVLRIGFEVISDIDSKRVRINGQPAIIEQTVYVPSEE
jgi:hypothetical protein